MPKQIAWWMWMRRLFGNRTTVRRTDRVSRLQRRLGADSRSDEHGTAFGLDISLTAPDARHGAREHTAKR